MRVSFKLSATERCQLKGKSLHEDSLSFLGVGYFKPNSKGVVDRWGGVKMFWKPTWGGMKKLHIPLEGVEKFHLE